MKNEERKPQPCTTREGYGRVATLRRIVVAPRGLLVATRRTASAMPDSSEQLISDGGEALGPQAEPLVSAAAASASGDGQPGVGVDPAMAAKRKRVQMAIVGALLLVITLLVTDQVTKSCTYSLEAAPCYQAALRTLVAWVRDNPGLGVLAVIVVYAFAAVRFIPGSIITLGVGAAFASALGLVVRPVHV